MYAPLEYQQIVEVAGILKYCLSPSSAHTCR